MRAGNNHHTNERDDSESVRKVLEEGASVRPRDANGRRVLVAAASANYLGAAGALIEAGADVNAKDGTEQNAYLISTSEVGDDPRLLEMMLANGADVRSLDSYNGTGLIRAADRGHARIVGELLESGTDVDHVNDPGWRRYWRRSSSAEGTSATRRSCGSSWRAARTRISPTARA